MGGSNVDGDGGKVDGDSGGGDGVNGDGSGGTSSSWQGAGTETSVPQNWSLTAAALQNFTGKNAERFRVFMTETLYRRRGNVRGRPGPTHHWVARPRGHPRHQVVWLPLAPLRLLFGLHLVSGENRNFGLCFIQFREYFLCNFSETQK
jgi:hypothetical protein